MTSTPARSSSGGRSQSADPRLSAMTAAAERDHLFISYASEDAALAEWLTLKLTAGGYRAWCDRVKLLGGESYPRDIDSAIEKRTFRMVALMSRSSKSKDNPVKERTKALALGRQRTEDFLIPLRVDDITPAELDWMTADLTWIDFSGNWAAGFRQLLKKLDSLEAPRTMPKGTEAVARWYDRPDVVRADPERLHSNLMHLSVPTTIKRLFTEAPLALEPPDGWPLRWQGTDTGWAFELPDYGASAETITITEVAWNPQPVEISIRLSDVVAELVRKHALRACVSRGLTPTPDGESVYFPAGMFERDRLKYASYTGKSNWVQVAGMRSFRTSTQVEKTRYHLAFSLRSNLWQWPEPMMELQLRLHLTDEKGEALPDKIAFRRRKKIVQFWFNHQWLSRVQAVASWLSGGAESIDLGIDRSIGLRLSAVPEVVEASSRLDEGLVSEALQEEPEELEDPDEVGSSDGLND